MADQVTLGKSSLLNVAKQLALWCEADRRE
jgi:hypothetical protein